MSGLDLCMLMTDQVHLAAQLEAEFTAAPHSFLLSLRSLSLFPFVFTSQHCCCVGEGEKGGGEGEGNDAIMFLTSPSHFAVCLCTRLVSGGGEAVKLLHP